MAYMTYDVPHAVISSTAPGDGKAAVAPSDKCRAVLRLSFCDIWAFVAEHWGHVEALVIHCDAG